MASIPSVVVEAVGVLVYNISCNGIASRQSAIELSLSEEFVQESTIVRAWILSANNRPFVYIAYTTRIVFSQVCR